MKSRALQDVGIYHDSDVTLWHFGHVHDHNGTSLGKPEFLKSQSVDRFIESNFAKKFAAYHVAFPVSNDWLERLIKTYNHVLHTFVFCSELHQNTVEQLYTLDLPNVSLFVSGFINYTFKHAKVYRWMDWFVTTNYFYREVQPNLLKQKLLLGKKSKHFDILLGCRRTHRDFVYQYITDNQLVDQVIMTYYQRWNVDLRTTDHIFETEGLEFLPESNYTHSVHQVRYYGHQMNLSQVVPFVVYNDSYYSVVAETNAVNEFNFYTEKIVKPILAGRLFVVISGQGYLKNLRSFGFRTFEDVIDESYDNEPDHFQRWRLAMDQVRYLTTQNPEEIYSKIRPIVEHNQKIMLTQDWYKDFTRCLVACIDRIIAD